MTFEIVIRFEIDHFLNFDDLMIIFKSHKKKNVRIRVCVVLVGKGARRTKMTVL